MAKYNDDTPMPFGIHKGKKLADVPADYLLFLFYEKKGGSELMEYLIENKDALEYEVGVRSGKKQNN